MGKPRLPCDFIGCDAWRVPQRKYCREHLDALSRPVSPIGDDRVYPEGWTRQAFRSRYRITDGLLRCASCPDWHSGPHLKIDRASGLYYEDNAALNRAAVAHWYDAHNLKPRLGTTGLER